jgi:hypothetical protein
MGTKTVAIIVLGLVLILLFIVIRTKIKNDKKKKSINANFPKQEKNRVINVSNESYKGVMKFPKFWIIVIMGYTLLYGAIGIQNLYTIYIGYANDRLSWVIGILSTLVGVIGIIVLALIFMKIYSPIKPLLVFSGILGIPLSIPLIIIGNEIKKYGNRFLQNQLNDPEVLTKNVSNQIRIMAIDRLNDHKLLLDVFRKDKDEKVQIQALKRIEDLGLLSDEESINDELLELLNRLFKREKNFFTSGDKRDILYLVSILVTSSDAAKKLIEKYDKLYKKDLIVELKKLSSTFEEIKENLAAFINVGIVEEKYPHKMIS